LGFSIASKLLIIYSHVRAKIVMLPREKHIEKIDERGERPAALFFLHTNYRELTASCHKYKIIHISPLSL